MSGLKKAYEALADERDELDAENEELQKFREQHDEMVEAINKERDYVMKYTTLIWELT